MKLPARLRRFKRARAGMAAVEFALIAPMMVFVLFGSIELLNVLDTNSRVENTSASLADVVARDTEVSNAEVSGLWDAMGLLMYPYSSTTMRVRITSISVESATVARVIWSEGRNISPLNAGDTITIPDGLRTPGTSLILAETQYDYAPPLRFVISAPVTLTHETYRRSRLVDPIPRV